MYSGLKDGRITKQRIEAIAQKIHEYWNDHAIITHKQDAIPWGFDFKYA